MKRLLYFIYCIPGILLTVGANAQIKISGTILDSKSKGVKGANVYIDNTIDGATADSDGVFSFTTTEKGNMTLVVTDPKYKMQGMPMMLTHDTSGIVIHMLNAIRNLEDVTITAGSFGSGDRTKTVMNPIEIVTTAGSNGDVVKAMEMMPGTQQTGTETGLFVRGGDASEVAIIADGMVVQSAFSNSGPGVPGRSRFNPFQFQGVAFSSGGYSARFGQALSGVLDLNTNDLPEKSNVNLGLNSGGVYASGTKRWKKSSFDAGGGYNNLTPFYKIAKTNFNFYDVPVGGSGYARYVWTPNKNAILKASVNTSFSHSGIKLPNPYTDTTNSFQYLGDSIRFTNRDQNTYTSISYKQVFKNKYTLFTAASYSLDRTNNSFGPDSSISFPIKQDEHRAQFRIEGKDFVTNHLSVTVGAELQSFGLDKNFGYGYDTQKKQVLTMAQNFIETQEVAYAEAEWAPIYWLALKPGVRYEHSTLLNKNDIAPRLSMAIKTGMHSQISLATGIFYQTPGNLYLLAYTDPNHPTKLTLGDSIKMQSAIHYIANWQWNKNDRTFRIEGYYKSYQNLITELGAFYDPNRYRTNIDGTSINNSGYGYAQGFELFWRDKKTFKNADYWISYSYIDTKRLFENYPVSATPTFIAKHTLNVVGKYFVDKLHTNFSATYSFSSGYPYYNPNNPQTEGNFLKDVTTPTYNNVALTVAYLHSFGKWFTVFYLSADNILNTHNVFGERFIYNPATKKYDPNQIVPPLYRAIFIGANFSLSQFSKDEL